MLNVEETLEAVEQLESLRGDFLFGEKIVEQDSDKSIPILMYLEALELMQLAVYALKKAALTQKQENER